MDKIKALMVKCGLSLEAAGQICESIQAYNDDKDRTRQAEFNARLSEAKRICVEELQASQAELARRLQVFCEAKGISIEKVIAKQSAIKESAALSKLRDIQSVLVGVQPKGEQNGDLSAEVNKLKRQLNAMREERDRAVTTSNRSTAAANKVLERNRELTRMLSAGRPKRVQAESVAKPKQQPRPQTRLDSGRSGGNAQTTRSTLVENQDKRSPAPIKRTLEAQFTPDGIAEIMEEDL